MINNSNDALQILISLFPQNNTLYGNYLSLIEQNPINQISFLQKKRFLEKLNLNNNQIFLQKINNFNYLDERTFQLNEFPGYSTPQLGLNSKFIKSSFIYSNNTNLNESDFNYYLSSNLNKIYIIKEIEKILIIKI